MDDKLKEQLRQAYNRQAEARENRGKPTWQLNPRNIFGDLLLQENKKTLLELGAGTGEDGRYFQDLGLDVLCTDLSPEHVRYCQAKGLNARVMDNTNMDLPSASFDAVYAMNSLLHLPKKEWPAVLQNIQTVLKPDGLFFMGVYGGMDTEGVWEDDHYDPKRFFAFYTDDQLKKLLSQYFVILEFTVTTNVTSDDDPHHQAVTMRKA
jgi:SAM-dependent methyltransferase